MSLTFRLALPVAHNVGYSNWEHISYEATIKLRLHLPDLMARHLPEFSTGRTEDDSFYWSDGTFFFFYGENTLGFVSHCSASNDVVSSFPLSPPRLGRARTQPFLSRSFIVNLLSLIGTFHQQAGEETDQQKRRKFRFAQNNQRGERCSIILPPFVEKIQLLQYVRMRLVALQQVKRSSVISFKLCMWRQTVAGRSIEGLERRFTVKSLAVQGRNIIG